MGATPTEREQLLRGGRRCSKVGAGAARWEQVPLRGEQVQGKRAQWEQVQRGWKRCSEVGAGAARWEQMQRDRIRCSEVEQGAARWEYVERGQQNKKL